MTVQTAVQAPELLLPAPRGIWHHSLRFRLALFYSLTALLIIAVVGLGMTGFLLDQLDQQFQQRLNERADSLADSFIASFKNLEAQQTIPGATCQALNVYCVVVDPEAKIAIMSAALKSSPLGRSLSLGDSFPYLEQERFEVQNTPMRAVTRDAGEFGKVWVALPEYDMVAARRSALRSLLLVLVSGPFLMMLLGWWVGNRTLRHLGRAADLADHIDPAHNLRILPLPKRQDEVHRLLAAINRLMLRIEAVQNREKQLLGQIVHELGAPLTVLRASLARASERTKDPEVSRAALVADEMTFTTQDLMQLARGQLELKLAWHYIPAQNLQSRLDRLVPDIQFSGDWRGGILCDPDRLTQALRNLLANARRAAGPAGLVRCDLHQGPQEIVFTVRDSGAGLPSALGESIFAPFVSGSGSSGLGLSVARQIALMHGGNLTGRNHEAGGAEFVLNLPGAELNDEEEDRG